MKCWIDTDVAIGTGNATTGFADVDDAYALLHLLSDPAHEVVGVSTVFGNTDIAQATRLAQEICTTFAPQVPVYRGAAGPIDLRQVVSSDATAALARRLAYDTLTIVAIGPATNIGTLLLLRPDLAFNIREVILVAGRRTPDQHFRVGPTHEPPFPDLNFDLDPDAFRVLLQHNVPVTLLPFEISHKVWFDAALLDRLDRLNKAGRYLASRSRDWLAQWRAYGCEGFNPFDVLATGYYLDPQAYASEDLPVRIALHPDDTRPGTAAFKPYLIAAPASGTPARVRYVHTPPDDFAERLLRDLARLP
ncbi:MAG: ribonucleoside hydrolase RihC [Bacteroidia bacterium]